MQSSSTFIGITNLECAVLPPETSNAVIPLKATVKTMPF